MKKGSHHKPESIKKISQSLKGKKFTSEHIEKLRIALKINRKKIKYKKGYKLDEDKKKNILEGILKKRYTKEYAKKLSLAKLGELNGLSVLTESQVKQIRELYNLGDYSQYLLSQMFNVSRSTIQDIVQYKTWKHI